MNQPTGIGHTLYRAEDFTPRDRDEAVNLYVRVVEHGHLICKTCGAWGVSELNEHCVDRVARKKLRAVLALPDSVGRLSPRERQVLFYIALGKTEEEVAIILNLAPTTVKNHMRNMFEKRNVHSKMALVTHALARGELLLDKGVLTVPFR
jgi:LuxR family transcriptional regulator of spore coat protein